MTSEPEGNFERPRFGPSDQLTAMFKACSKDPAEGIQTRLRDMLNTFLQHYRANDENKRTDDWADEGCHQAGIWYYKILEKLAIQEHNRLGTSDMLSFFNNELQLKCLVACCLEITMSSKNQPCVFPRLLQIFNLDPYHFGNVIEPLMRAEGNLPETAKKHLTQVMEKILESLAWTSDSPLWEEIRANGGHLLTWQQVMPPNRPPTDPSRTDVQPESNLPGAPANLDQQPSTSAESKPQRNKSFTFFVRKVYMLGEMRLKTRFSKLSISDELKGKIWTCFEHSLVNFPDLMKDRHLDQLLMCAIFIIAKTTNEEIPFERIVRCYKSQPFISESVCNRVLISGGSTEDSLTGNFAENEENSAAFPTPDTPSAHYPSEEQRGNLSDFFYQIYSPKMSDFANKFAAPVGASELSEVSSPPLTPYPTATPRRLLNNCNIYVSPFGGGRTPQQTSGLTYTFQTSNSESLRQINKMVARGRSTNKRSCVALSMEAEEAEEEDDGPPLRKHCSENQPALLKRLMDVENDRAAGRDQA